jgi:hypothetical protein
MPIPSHTPRIIAAGLASAALAAALTALWQSGESTPATLPAAAADSPLPVAARRDGAAGAERSRPVPAPNSASTEESVDSRLRSTVRACMADRALHPAAGDTVGLDVDLRVFDECLGETDRRALLHSLCGALKALRGQEQADGARFAAYLARQMLEQAPSPAEKAQILEPLLDGYRSIEGRGLRTAAAALLRRAYEQSFDERREVATHLNRFLERELAAGPSPHVLGPLLESTRTARLIPAASEALDPSDPLSPRPAIDAMLQSVERAASLAVAQGLESLRSSDPQRLQDSLYLLRSAFLAGSTDSASLREAAPRVLDALDRLDPRVLEESRSARSSVYTLLAQTQSRMRAAAAQSGAAPAWGGRVSPQELLQRFGLENLTGSTTTFRSSERETYIVLNEGAPEPGRESAFRLPSSR